MWQSPNTQDKSFQSCVSNCVFPPREERFLPLGYCNPLASVLMSTAICARWTMVGHHVCHGGYNSLQSENGEVTGRFHRRAFARGVWKRCTDWMDWMLPEVRWRSRLTVFVHSAPVVCWCVREKVQDETHQVDCVFV